jgi:hypothetical protein
MTDSAVLQLSWARALPHPSSIFSNFMEGETLGDLWSAQDFAHASVVVIDQN